jgi:uncharacterized coiled-coil protein SlyX
MSTDSAALESATCWWYDFSGRWLLIVGVIMAVAACATAALAFIQWRTNKIIEVHNEWRTGTLEKETAQAKRDLGHSQERIAELERSTAEANRAAAEENLALEKLRTPRSLNTEQQARLTEKLGSFAGQKYSFNVFPDPEAIALMRQIDMLKQAGWTKLALSVHRRMACGIWL